MLVDRRRRGLGRCARTAGLQLDAGNRRRNGGVVGVGFGCTTQMLQRRRYVARAEVEEGEPLQRAGAHGVEAEGVGPGVEGAGQVALVAQDPAHQIVGIGQPRIAGQAAASHLGRRIVLPPTPEGLAHSR